MVLNTVGGTGAYIDAVRTFLDTADGNISEIERLHSENDIRGLTVRIHALKSTSRIIGAQKLGSLAEKLENAGNANDIGTLESHIGELLSDYRTLTETLLPLGRPSEQEDKPLISDEKLKEAYSAIIEFSEALDYDSIEYVIKSLDGYRIPENETQRAEKLKRAVFNYDYELLPEILK